MIGHNITCKMSMALQTLRNNGCIIALLSTATLHHLSSSRLDWRHNLGPLQNQLLWARPREMRQL
jgi:hypothetical protein